MRTALLVAALLAAGTAHAAGIGSGGGPSEVVLVVQIVLPLTVGRLLGEAMLRIGQIYDLTNRRGLAMQAYKRAIEFAPEAEAAKDSKHYLSTPYQRKKQG